MPEPTVTASTRHWVHFVRTGVRKAGNAGQQRQRLLHHFNQFQFGSTVSLPSFEAGKVE